MRARNLIIPAALGLAAGAFIRHQRTRRAARDGRARRAETFASDPGDPVQGLDEPVELQAALLEVDALSIVDVEAAQDLAGLEAEIDEIAAGDDAAVELVELVDVEVMAPPRDAGDLYGAHTPPAVDRDIADADRASADGQSWFEALETSAIENGAEPERELDDIVDDEDVLRPPHASHTRDTPIADYGSGGGRGL